MVWPKQVTSRQEAGQDRQITVTCCLTGGPTLVLLGPSTSLQEINKEAGQFRCIVRVTVEPCIWQDKDIATPCSMCGQEHNYCCYRE